MIPGITAVQALAARHRLPLNRIAEPVMLDHRPPPAEGFPDDSDSVVVLLDGEGHLPALLTDQNVEIHWAPISAPG